MSTLVTRPVHIAMPKGYESTCRPEVISWSSMSSPDHAAVSYPLPDGKHHYKFNTTDVTSTTMMPPPTGITPVPGSRSDTEKVDP